MIDNEIVKKYTHPSPHKSQSMYKELLQQIYQEFHQSQTYSSVTSSHWSGFRSSMVKKNDNGFTLKGYGFGDFRQKSLLNYCRNIVSTNVSKKFYNSFNPSANVDQALDTLLEKLSLIFSGDCYRPALTIDLIQKTLGKDLNNMTLAVIGDGYGFLGCLLKETFPNCKIVSCNLGRQLFFDIYYTSLAHPDAQVKRIRKNDLKLDADFNFLEAENYQLLANQPIDLFFNTVSMQEMDNEIIQQYFELMRTSTSIEKFFYSCNRLEKKLPDGTITRHNDYPWKDAELLINESCPWMQKFPLNHPPFWQSFNGEITHKLAKF